MSQYKHFFPITKISQMTRESRLPPLCSSGLRSSVMLRGVSWHLVTDVSAQHVDSILKGLLNP
jgi:hypothetical protein